MKLPILISVFFIVFYVQGQGIQQIRDLYNQKADFERMEIDLARLIPGRGEREGTLTFYYLDCHYIDCSEYGISDDINNKVLRKVEVAINIDTENRKAEYLYDERGGLVFGFMRIASQGYYEDTDRECGQERYYFVNQNLFRIKIDPCEASSGESFDPIQKESEFSEIEWGEAMTAKRKAREYLDLFARLGYIQSLESRSFSGNELELAAIGMVPNGTPTKEVNIIDGRSAVFLTPIDFQNELLEKGMDEDDFAEVIDDNLYYFAEAQKEIRAKNIKVVEPTERFLLFNRSGKENVLIDRHKLVPGWSVILFDGREDPKLFSAVDIPDALSDYFK